MSTSQETARLWHLYPLGEPQPFNVAYNGVVFRGEVVRSNGWDALWGRPLWGDTYFRIVLLSDRGHVLAKEVQDSRIAVCVPARGPSKGRGQVSRELRAIRESQAMYLAQRDQESASIRSYLERQREELEGRLTSQEASRYVSGHIVPPTVLSESAASFFTGPDPASWFQRLASALLAWAYPAIPLEASALPRPVEPEDLPRIYDGIMAATAEGRIALGEFGPGLGLSRPETRHEFDPEGCQVFQVIRSELDGHQGELVWGEIRSLLAHATGLTGPLADLFILAFVHHGRPATELRLASGHGLTFRDGRPVWGTRLTWEFLSLLSWQGDSRSGNDTWGDVFLGLRLHRRDVSWNEALQYASLLCQGLTEVGEGEEEVSKQEHELLDALHELAADVGQARELLKALGGAVPSNEVNQPDTTLQRLLEPCKGRDFLEVYQAVQRAYANPQELLQGLDLLRRMLYLGESLEDIVSTREYLDGSEVASGYEQLSVDRVALLEEMSLSALLDAGHHWPAVRERVRGFQVRYRRAYVEHHASYQLQSARLWASLEDARQKLHALSLLNSLDELGQPVGTDLGQRYISYEQDVRVCEVNTRDLSLGLSPKCGRCQVALGEMPDAQELEAFLRDVDRALGEQNRRLSRVLVDRVLHQRVDQRLEDFLKIVSASDLSALSDVLNQDLTVFIRQLLRDR